MTGAARVTGALLAVGAASGLAALSQASLHEGDPDTGLVRLSWRTQGEVLEHCREWTAEELEDVPIHMRSPMRCEGRVTPYRLTVELDGAERLDRTLEAGGARSDRPVVVLNELPVPAGRHHLRVVFEPTADSAVSAPLRYDDTLDLPGRAVALITLDARSGRLVLAPSER